MNAVEASGAEVFLRTLAAMGVDHLFASPGSEWAPVWEYLAMPDLQRRFRYFSSRHEEVALGMASGYAKASGKLAAVMIHTTVGALHGAMAMRAALHEQIPMVVFAGESVAYGEATGPDPGPQWLRNLSDLGGPARLVERCVKWSFGVNASEILASSVQRACQIALAPPRGPCFVSLPMEHLFGDTRSAPASELPPCPSTADPRGIERLAGMLRAADSPVIVAELAGRSPRAGQRLVELAELLGAPVVETRSPGCVNFPRSHPLHAGFDPLELLREADLVFLVAAVAPWHPPSAAPQAAAKVAVLDDDPLRTDLPFWGFRADLCLTGSVDTSLEALVERLKSDGVTSVQARAEHWRSLNERRRAMWDREALACRQRRPLDARWVAHELDRVLPADAMVVEETITHRAALLRSMRRLGLGSAFNGSVGGLGTGLGTALGVKAAAPERPVVALLGDGTLNYNPMPAAFGFAQEYRMPIMVVVFNNHGYLSQKAGIPEYYPRGWAVKSNTFVGTSIAPSPDYAAIARAFEGYGEMVEDPSEVGPALERGLAALADGRLALLDMRLEPVNR